VGIARTLLKNPPILLLDEATSALDTQTERDIQDSLEAISRGRTVIAIAHRLSTIADADRIVVIDKGRIIEQGSHQALLALDGRYAAMWARQTAEGSSFDRTPQFEAKESDRLSKRDDAVPRTFTI
jgi:ATP-binding cassette subfamily B protein